MLKHRYIKKRVSNMNKQELIQKYEDSFVQDYEKWQTVLNEVNLTLPEVVKELEFDCLLDEDETIDGYTYNSFCSTFKEEIEDYLKENDVLTEGIICFIFDYMIKKKIIEHFSEVED